MNKKILISGLVVLVIGILLITLSLTGMIVSETAEPKDPSQIKTDPLNNKFPSYDPGDTVLVRGRIYDKNRNTGGINATYEYSFEENKDILDSNWNFYSDKDIGDEGDTVTVNLLVKEEKTTYPHTDEVIRSEYMALDQEGGINRILGLPLFRFIGRMLGTIGAIITVLGIISEKEEQRKRSSLEESILTGDS